MFNEADLHRLIMKMLILSILEEQFVALRTGGPSKNVVVYVILGKKVNLLMNNQLHVYMSSGHKGDPLGVSKPVSRESHPGELEKSFKQDKSVNELAFIYGGGNIRDKPPV